MMDTGEIRERADAEGAKEKLSGKRTGSGRPPGKRKFTDEVRPGITGPNLSGKRTGHTIFYLCAPLLFFVKDAHSYCCEESAR